MARQLLQLLMMPVSLIGRQVDRHHQKGLAAESTAPAAAGMAASAGAADVAIASRA